MKKPTSVKPMQHQQISMEFLASTPRALDMSDPGTGKTFVEIEDIYRNYRDDNDATLVLAPKSLLQSAWGDDIDKFRPDLPYSIAWAENREEAFKQHAAVYITNIDAATWLAKQKPAFFKRFSRLIIDESTAFKHATSQRSKAMAKIAKHFEFRRAMSGTFYSNHITDVWHQTYLIDDGERLGNSFFKFRAAVCDPVQNGPKAEHIKWEERSNARVAVAALLQDITVRHVFEDCIDIPANHEYTVPHHLPKKLRRVYDQMEAASIAEFKGKIISAPNAAVVQAKLQQIASGAVYALGDTEGVGAYELLDTSRYELIADMVEQRQHGVVFFHWTHQRDELIKQFDKRGITWCLYDGTVGDKARAQNKRDFQAGFYNVFLAHPKSAGHGLTLTKGTYTLWASPTYSAELLRQGKQRVYRNTQQSKTENIILLGADTVDQFAHERCNDRTMRGAELNSYLENYRK